MRKSSSEENLCNHCYIKIYEQHSCHQKRKKKTTTFVKNKLFEVSCLELRPEKPMQKDSHFCLVQEIYSERLFSLWNNNYEALLLQTL